MSFNAECNDCGAEREANSWSVWSWMRAHEDDGCPNGDFPQVTDAGVTS